MITTIRSKVDNELTRRVGTWFTVRQIQDKLKINPSTLKPLIMKYARENLLRRRHVKGTARSVEFSPAAGSITSFRQMLLKNMPYRNLGAPMPMMMATMKMKMKKPMKMKPASMKKKVTKKKTMMKKKK